MVFDHDFEKFPELTNAQLDTLGFTSPHKQIVDDFFAKVVKVHDGDTVTVRTDFRDFDFPIRLADINAPELNEGGETAKEWLSSRLLNKDVIVGIDFENRVGKYGRLIGSIISNGMNIGLEMLYLGLVKPFGVQEGGELPNIMKLFSVKSYGLT